MARTVGVVLAGGGGTRLWPLSRSHSPKQFLEVDGTSLLIRAIERARTLSDSAPIVLTSAALEKETFAHLARHDLEESVELLAEPVSCDTAFSIINHTLYARALHGDDVVLAFLPADHMVDEERFAEALGRAVDVARTEDDIVLVGVEPTSPEEGLGYITFGELTADGSAEVTGFVEKPTARRAQALVESGAVWNAGVVVSRPGPLLTAITSDEARTLLASAERVAEDAAGIAGCEFPRISFDHAVLEHTRALRIVPTDAAWNDLGSYTAYEQTLVADDEGNRASGTALMAGSSDSTVISTTSRVILTLGLEDAVVVDTADALLVARKDALGLMKGAHAELAELDSPLVTDALEQPVIHQRPWGLWKLLSRADGYWVKRIEVSPGRRLSLQEHADRTEHWTIVAGTALVELDGKEIVLQAGSSLDIPRGASHRLTNPGTEDLIIVEVARGEDLSEADIVRHEDDWARPE